MERGSASRRSSLTGRERAIVNQTNIGILPNPTLGNFLSMGTEGGGGGWGGGREEEEGGT